MPIEHLVLARGHGILTDDEVFEYRREVWSRPEVEGYGRMYQTHRELDSRSTRAIGFFRTRPGGLAFLGLDDPGRP